MPYATVDHAAHTKGRLQLFLRCVYMVSRRKFVQGVSVTAGAAVVSGGGVKALAQHGKVGKMARAASIGDVTKFVNIFFGT